MAQEPTPRVAKKLATKPPTANPLPKTKPAQANTAGVGGPIIRKDPPSGGSTQPLMHETTADEASLKETAEPQSMDQTISLEPSDHSGAVKPMDETIALGMSSEEVAEAEPNPNETMALDMSSEPETPEPAKASPADAEKNATILGDYKLLKKLGEGGMGAVYKAQHMALQRIVAIKVLAKQLVKKKEFVQRFEREARVMAKLDHPNVLRCIDVKLSPIPYIVMEFVDGGSVEGYLKKLGRFSLGDAMHIVLKTAYALQHAHDKSLIHRDIKPDNLLLTKAGVLKVADLGLAKDTDDDTSLTKSGAGAGTPIYMAPEQAYNVKHCDSRVDIYALGVMLYVFLTGQPPFQGTTSIELIMAKEKGKFDPIRKHNQEVPSKIDLIVDKMLAKDPKARYASCQEVIDALESLGLANDELSFMAPETGSGEAAIVKQPAKPKPAPAPTKMPAAKAPTKMGGAAKSAEPKTNFEPEEEGDSDVWYWKLVTQEGKAVTKKVTTDQVRTLIKLGKIDPTAEISKSFKSGYRAAASFPEFQSNFKSRQTATAANVKGKKYRDQYKEIEEEDARRRRWRWLTRYFQGFSGTLFGLLWIVLILAIVGISGYLAYVYLR